MDRHPIADAASNTQVEKIAPYRARFGRSRPIVAIIGENGGTELTDFVIPFGVLSRAAVADVIAVATLPGVVKMFPALQIHPQATIRQFDLRFPDGADYLIVPAIMNANEPALLAWVAAQGNKGGTVVSICNGAMVVVNSGLMKGHRATAHWASEEMRAAKYPDVHWEKNIRYVADGRIVSSAGISASIPISIALVEAIAGHDKAVALAAGHRPCAYCRRSDYRAYNDAVARSEDTHAPLLASELNRRLASERYEGGRGLVRAAQRRTWTASIDALPVGTVIVGPRSTPCLVVADRLLAFSSDGWIAPSLRPRRGDVRVLTPPTSLTALRNGYRPLLHPTADTTIGRPLA